MLIAQTTEWLTQHLRDDHEAPVDDEHALADLAAAHDLIHRAASEQPETAVAGNGRTH